MPDAILHINNCYVLSFAQIEELITNSIKLDSKTLKIINIFYNNSPLPQANEVIIKKKKNGNKKPNAIRLIVPRFATFFGSEQSSDNNSHFEDAFVLSNTKNAAENQQGKKRNKANFLIGKKTYTLRSDMGFPNAIRHLRKIFNTYYAKFHSDQIYFVVQFTERESLEKVHKQLGDYLSVNTYDKDNGTIEIHASPHSRTINGRGGQQNQSQTEHKNEDDKKIPFSHNRIIFGAPGTGKSHKANFDANELLIRKHKQEKDLDDNDKKIKAAHMERVTFHPEYSYFDFVGSYKPVMRNVPAIYVEGGISKTAKTEQGEKASERKIEYAFVPGPFTRILVKALKDKEHPHLLLIEEINRARVAAVFGDVFQLLDRTKEGESEYSICLSEDLREYLKEQDMPLYELKLPSNLYIWATMNSADQGVYPLDTAFKRRWSVEYQPLDVDRHTVESYNEIWDNIRKSINNVLLKQNVNEDKLMGYFFLKSEEMDTDKHLEEALKGKVLMYLFDDAAKPCRKDIFKEINEKRTYSELREALSLEAENLNIFEGGPFRAYNQDDEWDKIRKAINRMIDKEHIKYFYLERQERENLENALKDKVLNHLWNDNNLKGKVFKEGLQNLKGYDFKLADMGVFIQGVHTPVQQ